MEIDRLTAAQRYADCGYSVFPCRVGSKAPLTKNGLNDATTDLEMIERWFRRTPDANIGLVTDGLVVIDVDVGGCLSDDPDELRGLADAPMQETLSGGRHYVFKQPNGRGYRNTVSRLAPHVDTRANGGYIVVPPSTVDDGRYKWHIRLACPINDLPEPPNWLIKRLDAMVVTHAVCSESSVGSVSSVSSVSQERVRLAIERTCPAMLGTRTRLIFHFARELWAMYGTKKVPNLELKKHVREWHRRALPNIRTKEFDQTWTDFLYAWKNAKFPAGQEPISQLYLEALKRSPPSCSEGYETDEVRNLVAFCRELQRQAGDKPFFLDCRTAGRLIGVDRQTANRWLTLTLPADELLEVVTRGHRGRATEYRYLQKL